MFLEVLEVTVATTPSGKPGLLMNFITGCFVIELGVG